MPVKRATDADAEGLSITRLEGSRWRGGRLWSRKPSSQAMEMPAWAAMVRTGRVTERRWREGAG
jgi:hypothetical protein